MRLLSGMAIGLLPVLVGCDEFVDVSELTPECLARANFGNPEESHFVLPFPVGASYEVLQGYCGSGPWSSHNNRFALDFDMRTGDQVVAARSGIVVAVVDQFDDSGLRDDSELNYVVIEHEDGTAAAYAHIQQSSALVGVGDTVAGGDPIANSGNSGFTDNNPHLHFELYSQFPYHWLDDSIPVTFRNAGGALDERGGLQYGEVYMALP
ncbi:M23 family metallopeptidase [Gemmatimonadota bacterium]